MMSVQKLLSQMDGMQKCAMFGKYTTPNLLNEWLYDSGFINQKTIDISHTNVGEQRTTDWMKFESLADFLDPNDHTKTIEGYPAPTRIIITANSNRH